MLYESEDTEAPVQWLEYALPFSGEVEWPDCTEELIPDIEVSVIHQSLEVKPDADGEERIFVSDVVLELDMKFFRETTTGKVVVMGRKTLESFPNGLPFPGGRMFNGYRCVYTSSGMHSGRKK